MMPESSVLVRVFGAPSLLHDSSLRDWDLLIRQARSARLLASLYNLCSDQNVLDKIPMQAFNHLDSARKQAERTILSAKWELQLITKVANKLECPVIVLKGAAYAQLGFLNSRGRIFSDIDLLVPEEHIEEAESRFVKAGWEGEKQDAYDQEYYRKWMHELPPMRNTRTGVSLDLHHSILPKTASIKVDPRKLILNSRLLDESENLYVFSETDMILHSAVHLFNEGEFEHGLRDLIDLDYMLSSFSKTDDEFFERLFNRADELGLGLPLFYAVRYCQLILKRTYPEMFILAVNRFKPSGLGLMDALFIRALMPDHASCDDKFTGLARWLLYVRAHYLRMPLYLLIPHLVRKAYKRRFDDSTKSEAN